MLTNRKRDSSVERRLQAIKSAPPIIFRDIKPLIERGAQRHPIFKFGIVVVSNELEVKCVARDISVTGAKIVLDGADRLPERFRLVVDGFSGPAIVKLVWQKGTEAGVQFV